ncbi:outer membrane lipoprotein-sorting protein [Phaeobacter sp.]|uniref:outer membrane lipoprotein-sorting protein n=1 Tax=Phaeobacter sp. TaxID=1902409 RepID=UPI0025EC9DD4|nr:outer membrane lipoprotein-sorting protein [Phaeobacter sp.]
MDVFPIQSFTIVVASLLWAVGGQANVLEQIDQLRLPSGAVTVDFSVRTSDGQVTRFKSDQDGKGNSLAQIVSGGDRGEKYLYTQEGLWLFSPGSRRTIRIPKIQSLRGETVIGDITQLRFADDYRITEQSAATFGGRAVKKLALAAKSRASTFRTINLYVDPNRLKPIFAEYFLTSGKLFRTATFSDVRYIPFDGSQTPAIPTITFASPRGSKTELRIEKISSNRFSPGHFSPSAIHR